MESILIQEGSVVRSVDLADFPLALDAHGFREQVPEGQIAGWIAESKDTLFLQPGGGPTIHCNGIALTSSQWLHKGDCIEIGTTRIFFEGKGDEICFRVLRDAVELTTEPPAISQSKTIETFLDPRMIQPASLVTRSSTSSLSGPKKFFGFRPSVWILGAALVAAAILLLPAMLLKPVEIVIHPEPDLMSVEGSFLPRMRRAWLLRPGTHRLHAELAGYEPLTAAVTVTDQRNQKYSFAMKALPGRVRVITEGLEDIEIFVDSVSVGVTPLLVLEIDAGEHRFEALREGYRRESQLLEVQGMGAEQEVTFTLIKEAAAITIRSEPSDAEVRVDGSFLGQTPLTRELSAGRRKIVLRKPGFAEWSDVLLVRAEEPMTLPTIRLKVAPGVLSLSSSPPGATVLLNGNRKGETPLKIEFVASTTQHLRVSETRVQV